MEWKYEKYTIFKVSHDKRGSRTRNAKLAKLSLGTVVSIWGLQESELSSVRPRNFVLSTMAIVLFPCRLPKPLREPFLVTNGIKWVLSRFKENKLASDQSFVSWVILWRYSLKLRGSGFVIITLVSSANRTILEFSFVIWRRSLYKEGRAVDQVLILEVHNALLHPNLSMSERNNYLQLLFGIYPEDKI